MGSERARLTALLVLEHIKNTKARPTMPFPPESPIALTLERCCSQQRGRGLAPLLPPHRLAPPRPERGAARLRMCQHMRASHAPHEATP